MSDHESHSSTGRVLGLVTGLIALATAAVSAGLIHAGNSTDPAPTAVPTSAVPTSAAPLQPPATQVAVTSTSEASEASDWVAQVDGFCLDVQNILDQHRASLASQNIWARYALFGKAVKDVDSGIRSVLAGADGTRLQLMTQYWDTASDYLIQAYSLAEGGDMAGANADLAAYADPNAHGNQIANDLALSSCADLKLPD